MTSRTESPQRVAIIGGGCAAITAAFELTRPSLQGRYQVTVYQQGWRLGGKGASGRGPDGRIEEHGLHVWMGFYENAFRIIRQAYEELGRDPAKCPIATWRDAFFPAPHIGVADWRPEKGWSVWSAHFPALPGEPGDPLRADAANPFTVPGYLVRAVELAARLFQVAYGPSDSPPPPLWTLDLRAPTAVIERAQDFLKNAVGGSLVAYELASRHFDFMRALADIISRLGGELAGQAADLLHRITTGLQGLVRSLILSDSDPSHARRASEAFEVIVAGVLGCLAAGVHRDPRGFEILDDYDFAEWLHANGASAEAVNSPFLRGLYSLIFAYEDGDFRRPRTAAGQALRGCLRMFITYRGSMFYKMAAGMGDIIFAPLYEVLRQRGVRFEFFHRLENMAIEATTEAPHVNRLDFLVQAQPQDGEYAPLTPVKGLPCWPAEPDWQQLRNGAQLKRDGVQFESFEDRRAVETKTLHVHQDFDFVILGVGLGAVPHVAPDLVQRDPRWSRMVKSVKTVATCALQLWMKPTLPELGWRRGRIIMTSFTSPFDTWSDMSHLIDVEDWPMTRRPGSIGYFCNVLPDADIDATFQRELGLYVSARNLVSSQSRVFVERDLRDLWPQSTNKSGAFNWNLVEDHFISTNVNPSDRYTLCLPGTVKDRISPLDPTYVNLTVCGDWTDNGLNIGCVESAVISGQLSAHAIARSPRLDEIIGYDHP